FSIQHGGTDPLVMVKDQGQWAIEGEPDTRIEQGEVEAFLIGARRLDAARYVAGSADQYQQFGLATPWLTVVLETPERSYRIRVSRTGPDEFDHRYAATDGQADVFVMSADTASALNGLREQFLAE
ncbi:MAG: DUF4340 domain-containing protein, partial [Planctomycetota bacterium]